MADRPILFSGPMVRALLAGTKTQTRRAIPDRPVPVNEHVARTRYGIGDRLYVREHWRADSMWNQTAPRDMPSSLNERPTVHYEADGYGPGVLEPGRFRQGMHMPRWASRLTLTITQVRVERLQDCSEIDAISEGIEDVTCAVAASDPSLRFWKRYRDGGWNGYVDTAVGSYASLWTEINGPGSWEANPLVAAYTFTVERGNIDRIGGQS